MLCSPNRPHLATKAFCKAQDPTGRVHRSYLKPQKLTNPVLQCLMPTGCWNSLCCKYGTAGSLLRDVHVSHIAGDASNLFPR